MYATLPIDGSFKVGLLPGGSRSQRLPADHDLDGVGLLVLPGLLRPTVKSESGAHEVQLSFMSGRLLTIDRQSAGRGLCAFGKLGSCEI